MINLGLNTDIVDGTFLGTGFYINNGNFKVFITAKHVVNIKLKRNQKIGIGTLLNNGCFFNPNIYPRPSSHPQEKPTPDTRDQNNHIQS